MSPCQSPSRYGVPRQPKTLICVALALSILSGCAGGLDKPERFLAPCLLAIDVERDIFRAKCGASDCHERDPPSGLVLTTPGAIRRLVGVPAQSCAGGPLVSRTVPTTGVLFDRLSATGGCTPRMPLGRAPLTDAEITCVRAWAFNAVRSSTAAVGM